MNPDFDNATSPALESATPFTDTQGFVSEEVPSLTDFADEPGGAWANGWYPARVVEGYTTQKGKVVHTTDDVSQKGDSRNLVLALVITRRDKQTRNIRYSNNYRTTDFSAERLATVKRFRDLDKAGDLPKSGNTWTGNEDVQRSSLAIGKFGQIEKAFGHALRRSQTGNLIAGQFVGADFDVRLSTDDQGYNEITAFAKSGSHKQEYK